MICAHIPRILGSSISYQPTPASGPLQLGSATVYTQGHHLASSAESLFFYSPTPLNTLEGIHSSYGQGLIPQDLQTEACDLYVLQCLPLQNGGEGIFY